MIRCILLLFLFALPAFAQKNMYEAKWGSQGNGGGEWTIVLNQPVNQSGACIYGPLKIAFSAWSYWEIGPKGFYCVKGGHGSLHLMNFGGGPFFLDDEGYIFSFFVMPSQPAIRDFANGVH